jgi:hypothetical protein
MTIKDVIAHLQTMPPDMEVWVTWDESGEYWPATEPQGRVDWVSQHTRWGKPRWEESHEPGKGKAVCVLLSNTAGQGAAKPYPAAGSTSDSTKGATE